MKRILRVLTLLCLIATPSLVQAAVTASFTGNNLSGCNAVTSTFTPTVAGCSGTPAFLWYYINTTTLDTVTTVANSHAFTSIGCYDVVLRVVCGPDTVYKVRTSYVCVNASPVVNFTTSNPSVDTVLSCSPHTVNFINTTSGDTTCPTHTWQWIIDGPGGFHQTFATTNATQTFTTPGLYSVRLFFNGGSCGCFDIEEKINYIKIDSPAVPCFVRTDANVFCGAPATASFSSGCSSHAASYFYSTVPGTASGGTTSSTTSTTANLTFTAAGNYDVYLTAITAAGCSTAVTTPITVHVGNFHANFLPSVDTVCQGSTATVKDSSYQDIGSFVSTEFHVYPPGGGVNVIPGSPANILFTISGLYTVTDVSTNSYGCTDSVTHYVYVRPAPVASFSADTLYKCTAPLTSHFAASPVIASNIYTWSFAPATTSSFSGTGASGAATHTFTFASTSSVTLKVTDIHGCSATTSQPGFISITQPVINVQANADSGCSPINVLYNVSLVSPLSVPFSNADSIFIPGTFPSLCYNCNTTSHAYNTGGIKTVVASWHLPAYLGGCAVTDTVRTLIGAVRPIFNITISPNSTICPNDSILAIGHCSNCTFEHWNVRTDPSTVYDSYHDSVGATYHIPDITYFSTYPCWPMHYTASVNGCDTTVDTCIHVLPPPIYPNSLQPSTPSCARRDSFRFTANGATGATSYTWDFGDGSTIVTTTGATAAITSHQYTAPVNGSNPVRTFTVVVTANATTGLFSCHNRDTAVVSYGLPNIPFSIDNIKTTSIALDSVGCKFDSFRLVGPVQSNGSNYLQYIWKFGDGTSFTSGSVPASDTNAYHSYVTTSASLPGGVFRDTLIVVNNFGCRDTARIRTIKITGPNGGFTTPLNPVCVGSTVNFTDNNTDPGSVINSHKWCYNFPVSVTGSPLPTSLAAGGVTGSAYFGVEGNYHIVLNDSDANHCYSYDTMTLRVVQPHAYFTVSDTAICQGLPVTFRDTNTRCTYSWNFGDGNVTTASASDSIVMHTYTVNGTYSVTVTIVSNGNGFPAGCSSTYTSTNTVHITNTIAGLGIDNFGDVGSVGCPPLHLGVGPTPSPTSYLYSYMWHIYGGIPATSSFSGSYVFTDLYGVGTHRVVMVATTPRGCMDSVYQDYVVGGPSGYLTVSDTSGCTPKTIIVTYTDTGAIASGSNYIWNICPFGSNNTTSASDTLVFTTPGVYCPPTVLIQSGSCVVTVQNLVDSIRIYPTPNVTVSQIPHLCYGDGDSILTASGADFYSWAPSAGLACSTCTIISPDKYHTTTYTVTGTTIHGCIDTAIATVPVDSPLHITITGRDSICIGERDTLVASGVTGSYNWRYSPGISTATGATAIIITNTTETYWVVATNLSGCRDSASFTVTINPAPILHFTPDPAHVCFGDSTHLNVTGAAKYVWKPLLGLSCDSCANPWTHIGSNIIYSVTGTSIHGCRDSITVPVTVYYHTATHVRSDTTICNGDEARLWADGGMSYIWAPGNSLNNTISYSVMASPSVTTIYTVYIKENVCFTDTGHVKVTVIPLPLLHMPPTTTIIAGNSVQLYADTLNHVILTSYAWTPADTTLTCTDCPRPIATPIVTTTYSVTATTIEGCAGHGTVTIKLLCETDQVFIPNTFTPNGDGLNDRFYISGKGLGMITRMAIYNRWGEMVFEGLNIRPNDPSQGWDGTFRGQVVEPDVFVYVLEVLCSTGEPFTFRGDISLVR